ncbi:hypothetical protein F5J12DRAFT_224806 [Pisolithus orientalis]|uniref:uncharacterized protein n=1 Tax=Pisolithus orientalis TaxID=936130 RepID=UPI0022254D61|nr:uncharacterized protein F5J12DRAFT_224806 [Pisolithus orientalis]KAI6002241.1 hypothetical protein F5J12DRAFT_224806 [Pisolithus orientalis]
MGPLPCAHPGTRALDNVTDFDPCLDIYSLETEANNLMLIQPTRMYIPNPQILKSPPSFLLCLSTGYFWPSYHARSRTGASSLSVIGAERTTSDRQYLLHQRTAIQCGNGPFIIADFVLATPQTRGRSSYMARVTFVPALKLRDKHLIYSFSVFFSSSAARFQPPVRKQNVGQEHPFAPSVSPYGRRGNAGRHGSLSGHRTRITGYLGSVVGSFLTFGGSHVLR